ncbi:hypothetical protein ACGFNU_13555 [Spirillospora sp. NPDC048911]|uniref:hypothetical protein n=1 Tax=Spirillospora sp. NPDC048911 TaxID=3364527 RepID=UPI0037182D05
MTERPRWDIDERFTGIASGAAATPHVRDLLRHTERDGWVAEEPEAHLLPHLRRADAPFRIVSERLLPDGVYELTVVSTGPAKKIHLLREAIRFLAAIAEPAFLVRQVDATTIDCATGMLDGDSPVFAAHGHLVRLIVQDE